MATGVAASALIASPVLAAGEVNLPTFTWEGYADDSFIEGFEEASGCKVSATYVGSNDDFASKLAAGSVYDLISPSIDTTKIMIQAGFVDPIDLERVPRMHEIYKKFHTADGINHDGEVYGVPFSWGSIPFMYRKDKFETAPTSLHVLWDPAFEGKISPWDDKSALYVAACKDGNMNIYDLSDAELEAAKESLVAQKPLVRKYWATAGELVDLYANGEVWSPTPGVAISPPCWPIRGSRSSTSFPKKAPRAGWTPG